MFCGFFAPIDMRGWSEMSQEITVDSQFSAGA
jgi:hypothetical protein